MGYFSPAGFSTMHSLLINIPKANMPCTEPYKKYPTYPRFVVQYKVTRESCSML